MSVMNDMLESEYRLKEEIESLRQQLAANNPLLDEAANELDRQKEEIESLRRQLADREAQIVMLRDRLKDALWDETWWRVEAEKALAATEPKEQWK